MAITHFRQLGVYELAVALRRRVFEMSRAWPRDERYALIDQIRRSSRSVGACIAEAWAKRRYERHFISKLTDALGEAEETTVWLDVALECAYISDEENADLSADCRRICSGLVKMMREPEKWCGPAGLVLEDFAPYDTP